MKDLTQEELARFKELLVAGDWSNLLTFCQDLDSSVSVVMSWFTNYVETNCDAVFHLRKTEDVLKDKSFSQPIWGYLHEENWNALIEFMSQSRIRLSTVLEVWFKGREQVPVSLGDGFLLKMVLKISTLLDQKFVDEPGNLLWKLLKG